MRTGGRGSQEHLSAERSLQIAGGGEAGQEAGSPGARLPTPSTPHMTRVPRKVLL